MAACHTIKAGADSSATGASAPPKIGPLVLSTTLLYLEFSRMFIVPDLSGLVLAPKRKEKRKRKKKKKGKKEERKERKERKEKKQPRSWTKVVFSSPRTQRKSFCNGSERVR